MSAANATHAALLADLQKMVVACCNAKMALYAALLADSLAEDGGSPADKSEIAENCCDLILCVTGHLRRNARHVIGNEEYRLETAHASRDTNALAASLCVRLVALMTEAAGEGVQS